MGRNYINDKGTVSNIKLVSSHGTSLDNKKVVNRRGKRNIMVKNGTVVYITVKLISIQYITVQHGTVPYIKVKFIIVPYISVPCIVYFITSE